MIRIRKLSNEGETASEQLESKIDGGVDGATTHCLPSLHCRTFPVPRFPNWTTQDDGNYYVAAPIDQLLGESALHLRTHITAMILAGNPAIKFLQANNSPMRTLLALTFSFCGLETFFFLLVSSSIWLFDAKLGRLLAILLALGFYVAGCLKVALCLPRPPSPPAIQLADEERDWAWPSNHSLLSTALPWFIWIYVTSHYDMSVLQLFLLLIVIITWNAGVFWSRAYLGVHSPCDIVAGWIIGVIVLFVYCGFADRLHAFYATVAEADTAERSWNPAYFAVACIVALYCHPRAWPETQTYGEVVAVLSGAFNGIIGTRVLQINGRIEAPISLLESRPHDATIAACLLRLSIGIAVVLIIRTVVKTLVKGCAQKVYRILDLPYYSYSEYSKTTQPTKRFTSRMRFRPIAENALLVLGRGGFLAKGVGKDAMNPGTVPPYDIDLPVKFFVYFTVGFLVGEGCPALFDIIGI